MAILKEVKLRRLLKLFDILGFRMESQKGSHMKFKKEKKVVIIPNHHEISKGTLAAIIRQSGIKRDGFLRLLEKI